MSGRGLTLTPSQATWRLKAGKPFDVTGGVKIATKGLKIRITGAAKTSKKTGKATVYYTVRRPLSSPKYIYTDDWNTVVETALAEADKIEKKVAATAILELRDERKLRYEDLMAATKDLSDARSLLRLLQCVANLSDQKLPAIDELMHSLSLMLDTQLSVRAVVKAGLESEDFYAARPYRSRDELSLYLEEILPKARLIPTNEEVMFEFFTEIQDTIAETTFEQYDTTITQFSEWLKKPFMFAIAKDVAAFVRLKTVTVTKYGRFFKAPTHDHRRNILKTFFNFLKAHNFYFRDNPVVLKRLGNRGRTPSREDIISGEDLQKLLNAARWEDIPFIVCSFILGIRSDTIPRLRWKNFDWDRGDVEISYLISKCGKAHAKLTPEVRATLEPFMQCRGPLIVHAETPARVRQLAKKLGIVRGDFNNHARKSAISHRYAELLATTNKHEAAATMDLEFGNSEEVRKMWYECRLKPEQAAQYRACKRILPPVINLSVIEARWYLTFQLEGYVRNKMAILARKKQFNPLTAPEIVENITLLQVSKAAKYFVAGPSFPSCIQIVGGSPGMPILPIRREIRKGRKKHRRLGTNPPPDLVAMLNEKAPKEGPTQLDFLHDIAMKN